MAGRERRCAYVNCSKPLPAGARSDKKFCDCTCKAAHRRWRCHQAEAFAIGLAFLCGEEPEQVVRCPVCGHRFALGHGHRKDTIYDREACRQAAFRTRRRGEGVREAVTRDSTLGPSAGC
ncbi:hypothetical protein Stsp01_66460 [Streptomyces sp. NBRC 13847]|uniref:hypothetical protein n=1 Tax=Streptomyces TaxID=1883 RepID=UPI0024A1E829|nr:hypothetical protein [Streptomyces sp. NBRC 13847]GLW19903.1 hypothetical protein Stsp01_66460 [Streptomyces sp. NBRC 13847]